MKHPSVKAILNLFLQSKGPEIHHNADLPSGSGLGSDSAVTVSLINALHALYYKTLPKKKLVSLAIYIEQKIIQQCVGSQDQIAVSFRGFNKVIFYPDDTVAVEPLCMLPKRIKALQDYILLLYTGSSYYAPLIAQDQVDSMPAHEKELKNIQSISKKAVSVLEDSNRSLLAIGHLLHESWLLKRSLSDKILSPKIDEIYQLAIQSGAIGGKLIGARGRGLLMLFVEPCKHQKVLKALNQVTPVNIRFEKNGSKIILFDPDQDIEDDLSQPLVSDVVNEN